jgi:hypothetical protein
MTAQCFSELVMMFAIATSAATAPIPTTAFAASITPLLTSMATHADVIPSGRVSHSLSSLAGAIISVQVSTEPVTHNVTTALSTLVGTSMVGAYATTTGLVTIAPATLARATSVASDAMDPSTKTAISVLKTRPGSTIAVSAMSTGKATTAHAMSDHVTLGVHVLRPFGQVVLDCVPHSFLDDNVHVNATTTTRTTVVTSITDHATTPVMVTTVLEQQAPSYGLRS